MAETVLGRLLLVALGGMTGSVARYLLSVGVHRLAGTGFPWGTLAVNALGSGLIGLAAGALDRRELDDAGVRLLLIVGVLGGFTTFSAFSLETLALVQANQLARAGLNVAGQVGLGLVFVWMGFSLARHL